MSCEDFQILLNRDLDGVLGSEDQKRLSAHVGGCARCGAEQASLQAIRGAFRDLRHVDVPPGLADRIAERAAAPRAPFLRIPRHALLPIAASILALCLVSGAVGSRLRGPAEIRATPLAGLGEADFRTFLTEQLAVPADRVDAIVAIRRSTDQRVEAAKADLNATVEKLQREEVEEIWKLLPPDARERYRRHDPSFTPPATAPR
jgi:hypothetical protein